MFYYAQIDENNLVIQIIVVDNNESNVNKWLSETFGKLWVETSFGTIGGIHYGFDGKPDNSVSFRYNYAGIGYTYDSTADAFYAPQPFPSWTLNTTTYLWEAPIPMPTDGTYVWDETTTSWIKPQENN